jgi:hypothetical protein
MTTLTINIPDDSEAIILAISTIVSNAGGEISISSSDDDLSQSEFDSLKSAYQETLLIKDSKAKGVPISDLWND